MSHGSRLLPCVEIRARVTDINGDAGNRRGDGYYNGLIQRALKALAYHTLYDKRTFTAPARRIVDLPKDFANIDAVHLFNGTECNMALAVNVYHKDHTQTGDGDYIAENHGIGDHVMESSLPVGEPFGLYFWNVQQGKLMLSSQCSAFENVFVGYRGLGVEFGKEPLVPAVLEEAVVYWVALRSLEAKMHDTDADKPTIRDAIRNCKEVLFGAERVWQTAFSNVKSPDIKAMKDHNIYKAGYGKPF